MKRYLPALLGMAGTACIAAGGIAIMVGFDRDQGALIAWGGVAFLIGMGLATIAEALL